MEIPSDASFREDLHSGTFLQSGTFLSTEMGPSRSDLLEVIERLPTKKKLRRVFQCLDTETQWVALRSMEKHFGITLKPSSGQSPDVRPDEKRSADGDDEATDADSSGEPRSAAAVSMAEAVHNVHEKPIQLAEKTSEHWERLSKQARTDVLDTLLGYEKALEQMINMFGTAGGNSSAGGHS